MIADLLGPTCNPGHTFVPGLGWFIFGGLGNDLLTSQRLRCQFQQNFMSKEPKRVKIQSSRHYLFAL